MPTPRPTSVVARHLTPRPLTASAFARHGEVIEASAGAEQRVINYGNTVRFHDLAAVDVAADDGRPLVSIFRSKPLPAPVTIQVMERHPLSSQAFYPLSGRPYLVVVAGPGAFDPANIEAFIAGAAQGVNYRAGVWHHYCLALGAVSDFLVIDRGGRGDDLDEVRLAADQAVVVDCL